MAESRHEVGIRLNGDASGLVGASKEAAEAQKGLGEQFKQSGEAAKRSAQEAEAFARRLKEQADTLGKTRVQVEQYRASQLSLTDAQRRSVDSSIAAIQAHERKAQAIASLKGAVLTATGTLLAYAGATALTVKAIINEAAELHNLSQSLGISTQALSAYRFQMQLAGVSNEEFNAAMKTLAKNISEAQSGIGDGAQLFRLLGNDIYEAARRGASFEELLPRIAQAFSQFADGPNKAALAMAFFGRAGERMIPMLNQGAEGFRAAAREAEEFKRIIGPDMARRADEFNSNLERMNALFSSTKYVIAQDALPALNRYLEQLIEGRKIAGSFSAAIRMFGLNLDPGPALDESIRKKEEELAAWRSAGPVGRFFKKPFGATYAGTEGELQAQLQFLKFMQRQRQRELGRDPSSPFFEFAGGGIPGQPAPPLPRTGGETGEGRVTDYQRLIAQAREMAALLALEAEATDKVTAGDRALVQLREALAAGLVKLTPEQRAEVEALFEGAAAMERDARARDAMRKATEEFNRERSRSLEARRKDLEQMEEENRRLEQQNAELGATTEELGRLKIARAEDALLIARQNLELANVPEAAEGELEYLRERVRLAERFLELTRGGAQRAALVEREKEAREQARRITDDLERSLTDATVSGLREGFGRGESVAQNFLNRLKEMFFSAVLTPIIQPIVRPVAQLVGGAVSSAIGGITGSLFPGVAQAGGGGLNLASSALSARGWFGGGIQEAVFGALGTNSLLAAEVASGAIPWATAAEAAAVAGSGGIAGALSAIPGWGWALGGAALLGGALGLFGGGGGPNPSALTLERMRTPGGGWPGQWKIGDLNLPDANYAQLRALAAALADPSQYNQEVLVRLVPGWDAPGALTIQGGPGESQASLLQKLLARVEPAARAAQLPQAESALLSKIQQARSGLSSQLGITTLETFQASLGIAEYQAPLERMKAARAIYDETLSRARAGDLAAIQAFPGVAQSLLGVGREVYASGAGFQDIFRQVNLALSDVLEQQRQIEVDILKDLPITIEQTGQDQIAELKRGFGAMLKELQMVRDELVRLREAA